MPTGIYIRTEKCKKILSKAHKGSKNYNWKGGKYKTPQGYILVLNPKHPFTNKDGYVYEHRLVIEKHLHRYLKPEERVHHKGTKYPMGSFEDKGDNRHKNLKLFVNHSEHIKFECNGKTVGHPFKKGEHHSIKTEFKKGIIPKTAFKKGCIPWNKGKKFN